MVYIARGVAYGCYIYNFNGVNGEMLFLLVCFGIGLGVLGLLVLITSACAPT
ncbi:MAG: hypothetical protein AMXMBFR84_13890 [Candidatus Hydrogenedentota bacterium]